MPAQVEYKNQWIQAKKPRYLMGEDLGIIFRKFLKMMVQMNIFLKKEIKSSNRLNF